MSNAPQQSDGFYRQQPPELGTRTPISEGGLPQPQPQQQGWLGKLGNLVRGGMTSHQARLVSRQKLDAMTDINQERPAQWAAADLPPMDIRDEECPWK